MLSWGLSLVTFGGVYALLALGLNVVWGMGGMVNLGLAGFFALGAYASALLTVAGAPIPLGVAAGVALAACAGAGLCRLTLKLRGDYLAIVTLGFAELVRLFCANEIWLTNGSDGVSGIPGPWRGALTPLGFNALFAMIATGAALVVVVLEGSRFLEPLIPGLSGAQGAALREFLIGAALICVMRLRPDGLLPERPSDPFVPRSSP